MDTLPQSKQITRADFEKNDFNVQEFLLDHHQYRTLTDLRELVSKWESRLEKELQETVNDNYKDLSSSQDHLNSAKTSLEAVKLEVLSFRAEISKMARQAETQQMAMKSELAARKSLENTEFKAKELLLFITTLEKLERVVHETSLNDHQVTELVKAVVELGALANEYADAAIIVENMQRLANVRESALRKVNERFINGGGFEVLMARARLYDPQT